MSKAIQLVIRLALSLALLFFIYQETGWATTLGFFLIFVTSEIQTKINDVHTNIFKEMLDK